MKEIVPALLLLLAATGVSAHDCDCFNYPFRPNPPCFGKCVGDLAKSKGSDLSKVKGLDPKVADGIKFLAKDKYLKATDFEGIKGKGDLDLTVSKWLDSDKIAADRKMKFDKDPMKDKETKFDKDSMKGSEMKFNKGAVKGPAGGGGK